MNQMDKFKKTKEKKTPELNAKRNLINGIFASINKEVLSQELITVMTAKVCDFIDLTGLTLQEVVCGLTMQFSSDEESLNKTKIVLEQQIQAMLQKLD